MDQITLFIVHHKWGRKELDAQGVCAHTWMGTYCECGPHTVSVYVHVCVFRDNCVYPRLIWVGLFPSRGKLSGGWKKKKKKTDRKTLCMALEIGSSQTWPSHPLYPHTYPHPPTHPSIHTKATQYHPDIGFSCLDGALHRASDLQHQTDTRVLLSQAWTSKNQVCLVVLL